MKLEAEQVLHMVGGSGDTSYASNSRIQEKAISKAMPTIEENISSVYRTLLPDQSLAVADLGCSSGPNAFMVISNLVNIISGLCGREVGRHHPEILFFLNDLPGNDFNTVFKSIDGFEKKVREEKGKESVCPHYVFGVPGTFYGRLFPKESIHFVHSSYSLHWLSQVPCGLESSFGAHLNQENIYIARTSSPVVAEAYLDQFRRDFSKFLRLRAQEIVPGGQMVLTILGRSTADPLKGEMTRLLELLTDALNSFVSEGAVDKAKLDEFHMPFYAPSMEEVREVVRREALYDLLQADVFELSWDPNDDGNEEFDSGDDQLRGQNLAGCVRAALEPMLVSQFGKEIIDALFLRFGENVVKHFLKQKTKIVNFTIALRKRGKMVG